MKTQARRKPRRTPASEREEKALDPVCGMEVDTDTDFFSFYKDHVYYFCSPGDKTEFDRHPEDYVMREKVAELHRSVD